MGRLVQTKHSASYIHVRFLQVCCVAITDGRANVPLAVSEGDQNALDGGGRAVQLFCHLSSCSCREASLQIFSPLKHVNIKSSCKPGHPAQVVRCIHARESVCTSFLKLNYVHMARDLRKGRCECCHSGRRSSVWIRRWHDSLYTHMLVLLWLYKYLLHGTRHR